MATKTGKLVVVGHGAAGLAAALSAAEEAKRRGVAIDITIQEKVREEEAGGNTRFSLSYMRMAAPDRIAPGFEADMREACGGEGDTDYFRTLAERAAPTMAWLQERGVEFSIPPYYLSVGPPRILAQLLSLAGDLLRNIDGHVAFGHPAGAADEHLGPDPGLSRPMRVAHKLLFHKLPADFGIDRQQFHVGHGAQGFGGTAQDRSLPIVDLTGTRARDRLL